MANINKIRVSGTTYDIQDINAPKVIELTQSEYDSLTTKDPNAFYVITDSEYNFDGYWTSAQTQSAITQSVSGKADTSAVTSVSDSLTAHTANTTVHVTAQDKTNWNAKSDFSGDYNDLSNKPTIPTSASQLTNDSGYITSSALDDYTTTATTSALNNVVTAHTANTSIHVSAEQIAAWNAKSDFSGSYNDLTNKLSAGTNITIVDNVISAEGGGKAIEAGRGISVTTGETADTVSFNLALSAGTRTDSIIGGRSGNSATPQGSFAFGENNIISYDCAYASIFGYNNKTYNGSTGAHIVGVFNEAKNGAECAVGKNNVSNTGSTTADKTLFSVGNGTAENARHNAFEIRQNGDIYLTKDGQDVKLQDQLGGSSINVVQTTGTSTTDVMSQNAVTTQLSGYVTTDTEQIISGRKIFTYTSSTNKAIEFKQTDDSSKVGFRVRTSAATNNELASFEFRPNTFTIDNVQHPLIYFGHYRTTNAANAGVQQTVIGFRQYDQKNGAAYHYLLPLPEKAKTPFGLTTTFKDYYAPMGFKNGSTMITADNTGVVDLSSELGGLKLKKLTQAEYDALATKDSNTLYVIVN